MQVTKVLWVTNPEQIDKPEWLSYSLTGEELPMQEEGWVRLRPITFNLPTKEDLAEGVIARLREQQRRVRVKAEEACSKLEDTIQSFLALEAPKDL